MNEGLELHPKHPGMVDEDIEEEDFDIEISDKDDSSGDNINREANGHQGVVFEQHDNLTEMVEGDDMDDHQLHYSPTKSGTTYTVLDLIIFQVEDKYTRLEEAAPAPVCFFFRYIFDPLLFTYLMFLSYRYWQISLKSCIGDIMVCFNQMKETVGDILKFAVFAAIIQFLILLRAFYCRVLAYRVIGILLVIYCYVHINSRVGEFSWSDHS